MKKKVILSLICLAGIVNIVIAQKAAVKSKTAIAGIKKCHLPSDSTVTLKMSLDQVKAWADSLPLNVICDDLKKYKLFNFNFTIITMNPFQSKEFGTGNGGIPILARNAIDALQPKDGIIIKNATYKDAAGNEQKLPVITFSIAEEKK